MEPPKLLPTGGQMQQTWSPIAILCKLRRINSDIGKMKILKKNTIRSKHVHGMARIHYEKRGEKKKKKERITLTGLLPRERERAYQFQRKKLEPHTVETLATTKKYSRI